MSITKRQFNIFEVPPPEKIAGGFQQAGKKEGGWGEGIFARLLTAPKARLGWERLRSLAPSREAKQNIFQFLLEEKGLRAKIEKREKCFALHRRQAGGAAGRVSSVQSRFALRSVIATMKGELVSFQTSDRLELPGILFEPVKRSKKIALFLHGNGSSSIFYSTERMNILAQELTKRGISFLPFNNRGAHYVKSFHREKAGKDERVEYGMAFELIRECVKDIDAAVKFLEARGYKEFYLIGHSTGANKICVYNALKPRNIITKYVLLAGGDDTGLFYKETGPKKFFSLLVQCEKMIEKDRGRDMVPGAGWISYQSLYDTINPDGEYNIFPFYEALYKVKLSKTKPPFKEFRSIKKPTLVLYGEDDEFCYARVPECVDALKKACSALENFSFSIIKNADHGFHGKDKELARSIARWLSVPLCDGRQKEVRIDGSGA